MTEDERWMTYALEEATRAESIGEVPVGAVVVFDGELVGRGHNQPISLCDPTAHAEIVALRDAGGRLENYRLPGAVLYATVEPCLMCMGALLHARVQRVVFGCFDPKGGAAGSLFDVSHDTRLNHQLVVTAGVKEEESRALLQQFFRRRRSSSEEV
jgi:tRNA(adenine34) deaminase